MSPTRCLLLFLAVPACLAWSEPLPPNAPDRIVQAWDFEEADMTWEISQQVASLAIRNGALVGTAEGADPAVAVRGIDLPADDITHVRVRMRANRPGATQIYFATSDGPNPAENGIATMAVAGDMVYRDYETRLQGQPGWSGRLLYFRVDPANGQSNDATFEIDSVTLVQKAPRPVLVDF